MSAISHRLLVTLLAFLAACSGPSASPQPDAGRTVGEEPPSTTNQLDDINLMTRPDQVLEVDALYEFRPEFTDRRLVPLALDEFEINIVQAPEGLTLTADKQFAWTPTAKGAYPLNFEVQYDSLSVEFEVRFNVYERSLAGSATISPAGGKVLLNAPGTLYEDGDIAYPAGAFAVDTEVEVYLLHGPAQPGFSAITTTSEPLLQLSPQIFPTGTEINVQPPASPPEGYTAESLVFTAWVENPRHANGPLTLQPAPVQPPAPTLVFPAYFTANFERTNVVGHAPTQLISPGYTNHTFTFRDNVGLLFLLAPGQAPDPPYVTEILDAYEAAATHAESQGCILNLSPLDPERPFIIVGEFNASSKGTNALAIGNTIIIEYKGKLFETHFSLTKTVAHEYFHLMQFFLTPEDNFDVYKNMGWWAESTATAFEDSLYPDNAYIPYLVAGAHSTGWSEFVPKGGLNNQETVTYRLITFIQYLQSVTRSPNVVCKLMNSHSSDLKSGHLHDALSSVLPNSLAVSYLEYVLAYALRDSSLIDDIGEIGPSMSYNSLSYPSLAWTNLDGWELNVKTASFLELDLQQLAADQSRRLQIESLSTTTVDKWLAAVVDSSGSQLQPTSCSSTPCFITPDTPADAYPDLVGGDTYRIFVTNADFPTGKLPREANKPAHLRVNVDEPGFVWVFSRISHTAKQYTADLQTLLLTDVPVPQATLNISATGNEEADLWSVSGTKLVHGQDSTETDTGLNDLSSNSDYVYTVGYDNATGNTLELHRYDHQGVFVDKYETPYTGGAMFIASNDTHVVISWGEYVHLLTADLSLVTELDGLYPSGSPLAMNKDRFYHLAVRDRKAAVDVYNLSGSMIGSIAPKYGEDTYIRDVFSASLIGLGASNKNVYITFNASRDISGVKPQVIESWTRANDSYTYETNVVVPGPDFPTGFQNISEPAVSLAARI